MAALASVAMLHIVARSGPKQSTKDPRLEVALPPVLAQTDASLAPVIDHLEIDSFRDLSDQQIAAAARLRMLFVDHSVGQNISDALDCTASPSLEASPPRCRRFDHVLPALSADPSLFLFGQRYDRSRWSYLGEGSSYWRNWPADLESIVASDTDWDVVIPMPSYLVAPNGGWMPLESLEAAHPQIVFVYATSSLPRGAAGGTRSDTTMQEFNAAVRSYAREHDKPLLDVADILSHDYQGGECFDTRDGVAYCQSVDRCENLPDDGIAIPAICQHYTSELFGGHLGSVSGGGLRMAQAVWLLMARLAAAPASATTPSTTPATTPATEATLVPASEGRVHLPQVAR